jgi:hypothetical protein
MCGGAFQWVVYDLLYNFGHILSLIRSIDLVCGFPDDDSEYRVSSTTRTADSEILPK